ncbi:MAG: efflux RND transporter periplasmic adaptor subunit [Alphaproteobacteria bacterium]
MKLRYLMILVALLSACKDKDKQTAEVKKLEVETISLQKQDIPLDLEFSGKAQGFKEVEVRSRVSGILLKRNYTEGADVEEGQVLFEIDPAPYQATLNQAKAALSQQQAQLDAAENQYHRMDVLFEDRIVSAKALDDAKATLDTTKASIELAKAEVESAQLNLDWTKVTAPISGITSLEAKSEGSLINATDLLTNITQLNPIYVMFSTTDKEMFSLANLVEKGLVNNPRSDKKENIIAKIKFDDDSFYPVEGSLNFTNSVVDQTTGTIQSRAIFENPQKRIMPGQFVRIVLEGLNRLQAISVPKSAVMQNTQGQFVYTINDKGLATLTPVVTGLSGPNNTWIIDEGLNNGDIVITSPLMKIRPDMPVKKSEAIKK